MRVTSPDGRICMTLQVDVLSGTVHYDMKYRGKPIVETSHLGLELAGAPALSSHFSLVDVMQNEEDASWRPVYGERHFVPNKFSEATAVLEERIPPYRQMIIVFRVFNEGAAFRYIVPRQSSCESLTISRELTEFTFPADCYAYEEHGTEGEYFRAPLAEIKPDCERPLTIEHCYDFYACLVEAAAFDYPRTLISPQRNKPNTLTTALGGSALCVTPFTSPWRGFIVGDRPGDLLERNYLIDNLAPACELSDTSWIKPGKVIRDVTLSTKGGKECVDFACAHGLQYVLYDAGWYGSETSDESDARRVCIDPERRSKDPEYGDLDLSEVVKYGRERSVGIILYVNRRALERQMDAIFPLYRQWGITGVKFGFVQVGAQEWTSWLHAAVRKAAEHQLLVDIHDAYRPSGFSRMYPNLLTQEGVRGNEHMPTARHNTILPFTRNVAGAADCTICYYNNRIKTTHAHQLALAVVLYSPLQHLFWYDRPADYKGESEVEFFAHVPTTWDDTIVVHGDIGAHATIARRKGEDWFVGSITSEDARETEIPLGFLAASQKYTAHIYTDTEAGPDNRTGVDISIKQVDATMALKGVLAPNGGMAIRLTPVQ